MRWLFPSLLTAALAAGWAIAPGDVDAFAPEAKQPAAKRVESPPATAWSLMPADITLAGPQALHQLLLVETLDGAVVANPREGVTFASSNPKVAVVDDAGIVRPAGDGEATITAAAGGSQASCRVRVENFAEPFTWSFRNHVQSVLFKTGCSSGPCHGAQAGKNGFKLSLRGYDPTGDYQAISRQALGRRIVLSDPGRSLLLTKPTGAVPHKGGLRFRVDSREYQVLADWIAAGAPAPRDDDSRLERLEILPYRSVLKPGQSVQIVVRAHFTDGHVEDVTRWAKYTSTNETVANVGENGLVNVMGYGEGAVTAWYLSRVVVAQIASPFDQKAPADVFAQSPRRNFIDELVLAKLESLNIAPSPPATDAEFIRRAFLDATGTLPTVDEVQKFLADKSPDKRDTLIDSLLARPEWVDYWSYKWSDLLLVNQNKLGFGNADNADPKPMWAYYGWIRNRVEANAPWDQVVHELLTAQGSTLENGATNFYLLHQDPLDLAETTAVAFLGTNINCARCHNHPLEKWTNDQYYSMANLFSRVRAKRSADGQEVVIFSTAAGDLIQPLTGKPQPPAPLDAESMALDDPSDRRERLADWLVAPTNKQFARSVTNRVWANYFGVGLVEPIDDMRASNPASNEELLAAAAQHLVDHKYDLKSLMRVILQSATYQRSSQPLPANAGDERFYSRYYPRRLMAEVLLDGISQVTAVPTDFKGLPKGWRAIQLPTSSVDSPFLNAFGRPERIVTCECERSDEPSMVQVLNLSNNTSSQSINGKLQSKGNRLDQLLAAKLSDDQLIAEIYLSCLSRAPTANEQQAVQEVLVGAKDEDRRLLLEDLYWGVLSSREFLFNH